MRTRPAIVRASDIHFTAREGDLQAVAQIAWAVPDADGAPLPCGFGRVEGTVGAAKTLDYDEVLLVVEGSFGLLLEDGSRVEGSAGDVMVIPRNTTVTYFGRGAKIFFVVTPSGG